MVTWLGTARVRYFNHPDPAVPVAAAGPATLRSDLGAIRICAVELSWSITEGVSVSIGTANGNMSNTAATVPASLASAAAAGAPPGAANSTNNNRHRPDPVRMAGEVTTQQEKRTFAMAQKGKATTKPLQKERGTSAAALRVPKHHHTSHPLGDVGADTALTVEAIKRGHSTLEAPRPQQERGDTKETDPPLVTEARHSKRQNKDSAESARKRNKMATPQLQQDKGNTQQTNLRLVTTAQTSKRQNKTGAGPQKKGNKVRLVYSSSSDEDDNSSSEDDTSGSK